MGKGYYDQFFSSYPQAIRVAVVFQIQFSKLPLPVDSWDQPLDWIVTESMILRTSTRGH
jgi:5-formyltetrahydrofolate cyclo-ligase